MQKRSRESNFELLRIVAMLIIVAHHFVRYANPPLDSYPMGAKWLFFFILESGGEVGVDVFLCISLWFITARDFTLEMARDHLIRTEAILLSYSIPLYFVSRFVLGQSIPFFVLKSVFPVISSLWWFMTSYAMLLIGMPFLLRGLRALGKHMHAQLVYVVVVLAFALPMVAFSSLPFNAFTTFVCLSIVISYIRWYRPRCLERMSTGWLVLATSFLLNVGLGILIKVAPSSNSDPMFWAWYPGSIPVVGEALGLILVFSRLRIKSRAINYVAKSTVGVYLLHEHPCMRPLFWTSLAPFEVVFNSPLWLPLTVAITLGVFMAGIAVDSLRRALFFFAGRIGKNWGALP